MWFISLTGHCGVLPHSSLSIQLDMTEMGERPGIPLRLCGSRLQLTSRGSSIRTARRLDSQRQPATIYPTPRHSNLTNTPRRPLRALDDRATPELSLLMNSRVVQEYILSTQRHQIRLNRPFPDLNRLIQRPDPQHCHSQLCQIDLQKRLRWLNAIRAHSLDNSINGTNAVSRRFQRVTVPRPVSKPPENCRGVFNDVEMKRRLKVLR